MAKNVNHSHSQIKKKHHSQKIFNDPIHGHIKLSPLCVQIVNTPQFERLRHIKQLGGGCYVFPGALHSRFEHSIGVCHLAGLMVRHLQSVQKEHLKNIKKELQTTETEEAVIKNYIEKEKKIIGAIDDKDIACVEIAGLCHDLGHGAFSHVFDRRFIPATRPNETKQEQQQQEQQQQQQRGETSHSNDTESGWEHEILSLKMLEYMIEENELQGAFEKAGLSDNDIDFRNNIDFIKKLIHPKDKSVKDKEPRPTKSFLYEIVSNEVNGIDVDKWDYFARDCHHLGIHRNFDHLRLIHSARVSTYEGKPHICYRDKDKYNVCNMFYTRNLLHRTAYQHKTVKVVEAMITDALVAVNDYLRFPLKVETTKSKTTTRSKAKRIKLSGTSHVTVKLSEIVEDIDEDKKKDKRDEDNRRMRVYMNVHDGIWNLIKISEFYDLKTEFQGSSDDPGLRSQAFEDARVILDRIEKRELYEYIGDLLWDKQHMDYKTETEAIVKGIKLEKKISKEIFDLCPQEAAKSLKLKKENVVVQIVRFDYGKYEDPIKNVLFWKKNNPDEAFHLKPEETSGVLPKKMEEIRVFVYYNYHGVKDPYEEAKKMIEVAFADYSEQRKSRAATAST